MILKMFLLNFLSHAEIKCTIIKKKLKKGNYIKFPQISKNEPPNISKLPVQKLLQPKRSNKTFCCLTRV
jgi:hypothetical protein